MMMTVTGTTGSILGRGKGDTLWEKVRGILVNPVLWLLPGAVCHGHDESGSRRGETKVGGISSWRGAIQSMRRSVRWIVVEWEGPAGGKAPNCEWQGVIGVLCGLCTD